VQTLSELTSKVFVMKGRASISLEIFVSVLLAFSIALSYCEDDAARILQVVVDLGAFLILVAVVAMTFIRHSVICGGCPS